MAHGRICALLMLYLCLLYVIVGSSASGYGYGSNPNSEASKNIERQEFYPEDFSVEGVIYCKLAPGVLQPLKGGVVRITCLGVEKDGYETAPFSILSPAADINGYFRAKLSSQPLEDDGGGKITQCKAFLHSSPLKTCPFAADLNNGLSGALLSAYRLAADNMRLYSVGPFVYNTNPPKITP